MTEYLGEEVSVQFLKKLAQKTCSKCDGYQPEWQSDPIPGYFWHGNVECKASEIWRAVTGFKGSDLGSDK